MSHVISFIAVIIAKWCLEAVCDASRNVEHSDAVGTRILMN